MVQAISYIHKSYIVLIEWDYAHLGLPAVIKKHFGTLCSSFPSNYKKTVKRLQ